MQRSGFNIVLEFIPRIPPISSLPRNFLTFRDAGAFTVIENCTGSMFGYLVLCHRVQEVDGGEIRFCVIGR